MKFNVIVADPPWFYNQRPTHQESKTKFGGGAHGTYQLMKDQDILELGSLVKPVADENCALFMWATMPRLDLGIDVVKAWGFRYVTTAFVWIKTNRDGSPATGPGYYSASNAEVLLLGVKGRMPPSRRLINQVVLAPRTEHSRKPEEFQDRIELMYPTASKLEMFARREREGYVCLGNEIDGMDIRDALPILAASN